VAANAPSQTARWTRPDRHRNRWDFAVGYDHANRKEDCIYWIETHTGSDDQIKVVLKKLEWLKKWLRKDGRLLDRFERDIVWVSSGNTLFYELTKVRAYVLLRLDTALSGGGAVYDYPIMTIEHVLPQNP
jgi:hypothetical protein